MADILDYKVKYIKTKRKKRKIVTYISDDLKKKQLFVINKIEKIFKPSIFSKGYVKGESIYTNSTAHLYNNYFIKTDIKDFFQSINHEKLIKELYREIQEIASLKDCRDIVNICSISNKGLPLGFVSSPLLANIYLKRFDIILYNKLRKLNCKNIIYTRYADDMIISFKNCRMQKKNMYNKILSIIEECLSKYCLKINKNKTTFIDFEKTQQVRITGVTIVRKNGNRRISIGRNNKRKLFYDTLNYKKSGKNDLQEKQRIQGLLAFYLSIEKSNFEDFLSDNMKKEIKELNYKSLTDLIKHI